MALARTTSAVLVGVTAHLIDVHVSQSPGLPHLTIVGLPDTSMNESPDRVRSAIVNSGFNWPQSKITVGLSPAGLPKRGPGLDVAIALGILASDGQIPLDAINRVVAIGELSLDGRIHPVPGALAAGIEAVARVNSRPPNSPRSAQLVCSTVDRPLVELVPELEVTAESTLRSLVSRLTGEPIDDESDLELSGSPLVVTGDESQAMSAGERKLGRLDLADVGGQELAKLAMEVAAVGGHHLALMGRAGVGKTLLAERLPGILPDLEVEQALEVTSIHQLAGEDVRGLIVRPPWCAPHHTASSVALVGGGSQTKPQVGLVSLAHRGILFLDEAAEFESRVLDAMREPLENGRMSIARAGFRVTYPARFQLILATNPCPCGFALDPDRPEKCRCTPLQRTRYAAKLSGPLLDRVDLRLVLKKPTLTQLRQAATTANTSEQVRSKVAHARGLACKRLLDSPWVSMSEVPASQMNQYWPLDRSVNNYLNRVTNSDSMRGRERVMRTMWTLADLADSGVPNREHIDLAMELRSTDLEWGSR
ncbi:MAG: YifB family Mg chelatase-like AAA ATPase [Candidatus Nanopelagicales bacterium]